MTLIESLNQDLHQIQSKNQILFEKLKYKVPFINLKLAKSEYERVEELKSLLKFSKHEQHQLEDSISKLSLKQIDQEVEHSFNEKYSKWSANLERSQMVHSRRALALKVRDLKGILLMHHKNIMDREKQVKILEAKIQIWQLRYNISDLQQQHEDVIYELDTKRRERDLEIERLR